LHQRVLVRYGAVSPLSVHSAWGRELLRTKAENVTRGSNSALKLDQESLSSLENLGLHQQEPRHGRKLVTFTLTEEDFILFYLFFILKKLGGGITHLWPNMDIEVLAIVDLPVNF
jgi:hypothetical protein